MIIINKNSVLLFFLLIVIVSCTGTEEQYSIETSPTETTPPPIIQEYKPPFIIEEFCPLTPEAVKQYCNIKGDLKKVDLKLSTKPDCRIDSQVAGPLLIFHVGDMQFNADAFGEPKANNLQEYLETRDRLERLRSSSFGSDSDDHPPECSQGPVRLSVPNTGDEAIAVSGPSTIGGRPCPVTLADFEYNGYVFYVRKGDRAMGHFRVYSSYQGEGCSPEELGRLSQDLVVPKLKAVSNN